ncbi:MAG: hypothetical protein RJA70_4209 [Pseudomonadota bacterium]|jgi:outer membrane protein OmpA-like peptidoglycan-associated protein
MGTLRCTRKQLIAGVGVPLDERTTIILVPGAVLGSLLGKAFDPGRSFLLPQALAKLSSLYELAVRMQPKQGVVVGHVNAADVEPEQLAEERAESVVAWMKGEAAAWLKNYKTSTPEQKRWGQREDRLMLSAVLRKQSSVSPEMETKGPVERFQTLHQKELAVDGILGPKTREKLIAEYFALSRIVERVGAAPAKEFDTPLQAHSVGANVSLAEVDAIRTAANDPAGSDADSTANENRGETEQATAQVADNARIDFVLFANDVVEPAPGAADGPEFLEWVRQCELFRPVEVPAGSDARTQVALQLFDKAGGAPHANAKYELTGPEQLSGVTDANGRLDHDDVLPGDYQLKLSLEYFNDPEIYDAKDKVVDVYTSPVVVLKGRDEPQVRLLGAVPRCELARLQGLLFEKNKAFLLPSALSELKKVREIYERSNPGELLVVGHTDATGQAAINDPLSLDRARSTLAYLEDDAATWLDFYQLNKPQTQRWGEIEDEHMRLALQQSGVAGVPELEREALVRAYMGLDGVELDSGEFKIRSTAHGCGENFPLDDSGEQLELSPADNVDDPLDRRVELFFFDHEFGIVPKPSSTVSNKGSRQYPAWRELAKLTLEAGVTPPGMRRLFMQFVDSEGQHLGPIKYRITSADGLVVEGTSDTATVRETLLTFEDRAILEVNGAETELLFSSEAV